jgi:Thioredoxin
MLALGDKVKVLTAKNFNSAILQSDVPAVGIATNQATRITTAHVQAMLVHTRLVIVCTGPDRLWSFMRRGADTASSSRPSTSGSLKTCTWVPQNTMKRDYSSISWLILSSASAAFGSLCRQGQCSRDHCASTVQGIATVAAVDCDAEANKQLCGRYEIRGFPTIKVFPGDKSKGGNKTPTDYQGSATAVGGRPHYSAQLDPAGASDRQRHLHSVMKQIFLMSQGHGLPKA